MFFYCFGGMLMCANEVEIKEKQKLSQIKNSLQYIYHMQVRASAEIE